VPIIELVDTFHHHAEIERPNIEHSADPEKAAAGVGILSGLRARKAAGPDPVKARAALSVIEAVLAPGVSNRPNWTLPRLQDEIEKQTGQHISKSRLSVVMRKKGVSAGAGPATR
jgi:hypothetical protein